MAGIALFLFSIAVYAYAVTLRSYNTQAQEFMGKGEISLTDSYDSESSRVSDFLKEDHCQEILDDTYHSLITNRKIDYYEVLPQPIEYVGEYKGSGVTVDGNESAIEQEIDGELITPVKTFMMGESFFETKGLENHVHIGESFVSSDYNRHSDQEIPVMMGRSFLENFSVNEKFEGYYLGYEKIKFVVKGFLEPDLRIEIDGQTHNLDHMLILPTIDASPKSRDGFKKLLTLIRCEGYVHYDNKQEYDVSMKEMEEIAKETGFRYSLPNQVLENRNIMGITYNVALMLLMVSMPFFGFSMILLFRELRTYVCQYANKRKLIGYLLSIALPGTWMGILFFVSRISLEMMFPMHLEIISVGATRVRGVLIILAVVFSFLLCKKTHERSEEIHRWTN